MLESRSPASIADPPGEQPRGHLLPVKKSPDEVNNERPQREYVPIKDFLNNVADHASRIGTSGPNKERRRKVAKMRSFYEGEMVLRWDDEKNQWMNKKKPGDALYIDPVLATFIDIITAQVAKSRSTLVVEPRNEEQVQKQQAAKFATELLKDAASDLLNARNTQREIKYGFLLSGEAYRYTYFDKHIEGRGIEKPKYGVKVAKGSPEMWECPDCNASGQSADLLKEANPDMLPDAPPPIPDGSGEEKKPRTRCPECDFPEVRFIGGREFNVSIDEGSEYENIGDVNNEFPDPLEMTVVGARDHISDSLVVIRDRMLPRCVLEHTFPDMDLPSTGTPDVLRYKEAAQGGKRDENSTMNGGEAFEMLHFQEVWLNPAVYSSYESPRDEELANGFQIHAKEKFGPLMPKGAYYCRVGKVIVDIYEQSIRECFSHAVNSITSSFHGQGEWDLLPLQEQKNELRSMQILGVMNDSFSPLLVRNGSLDVNKIPNTPGAIIKVNQLGDEKPLSHAIGRVPGGGTIPDAYVLDDKLAGTMQQRSGAFSSTTDLPDAKLLGTATGVATLAEHAVGRRAPMLALRAEMEKEQAYQILELRQAYWPEQMYESLDKKVGGDAGQWFRESNIRRDFTVEVVPESFMPQTAAQEASSFQALLSVLMPLAQGDPMVFKQLKKRAIELWGKGIDFDSYEVEKVEAATRLEKIKQIANFFEQDGMPVLLPDGSPNQQLVAAVLVETMKALKMPHVSNTADNSINPDGMMPDPLELAPLDVLLDAHAEFIELYTAWMKSSEGRAASMFLRTCVRTLIQMHTDAAVQAVISQKTDENLMSVPDLQAQQIAADAQAEQQAEHSDQQFQQQLEQETTRNDEIAAQQIKHQMIGEELGFTGDGQGDSGKA